jgi:hypothetical protein
MKDISDRGCYVFNQLFGCFTQDPRTQSRIPTKKFQTAKTCLLEMIANQHRQLCLSFVEFPRSETLFPWTLLFDCRLTGKEPWDECWKRCLAFRHQIEDLQDWASCADSIDREGRTHVAVCPRVDFKRVHRNKPHPFSDSGPAPPGFVVHQIRTRGELSECLGEVDGVIVSFFGHADSTVPDDAMRNYIEINMERLTVAQLQEGKSPRYQREVVFVFLNGCEVASMSLRSITPNTLVGRLGQLEESEEGMASRGRVHCLTTCHKLPSTFGALFARHFWNRFCNGESVGQALLESRRFMANNYANPFGLLYSLFGKGSLSLRGGDPPGSGKSSPPLG